MYKSYLKPIIDSVGAVVLFVMLLPIFIFITFCLFIAIQGNPFFSQKRPGKNEKIFSALKFKSMTDKTDTEGNLLPDHLRITKFGAFLRKSSLDEIPQLINVIKGDMSFIGPRPLLIRYLPYYNENEKLRHTVRPGITGLAQISGRNYITWEKKFELDVFYVNNISFLLDLKILLKTFSKVITSSGVAVATNEITEFFDVERKEAWQRDLK
mgnify:FL=1|tara:strand:+ start:39113 stop:39745 length:633 start_codon:yes stop_codon:yes gene_type:complete